MLAKNINYFKAKPVNIPKITILLDNGYHPDKLQRELEKIYPGIMRKIRFELSPKLSKSVKKAQGKSGFIPLIARWVIERTNSWMESGATLLMFHQPRNAHQDRCKSLVKNFERTLAHATTKINLCFLRLMLKRLAADTSS